MFYYAGREGTLVAEAQRRPELCLSLYTTLEWARELAGPGGVSAALPLDRLAALRGIAPRTLRDHLAGLERLGLLERRYAGQLGIALCVLSVSEPEEGCELEAGSFAAVAEWRSDDAAGAPGADKVALLTAAGVYLPVARALASRPWVTREIIAAWIEELRRVPAVRNLAAVLVYRLQEPSRCLPIPGQGSGPGVAPAPLHDREQRRSGDPGGPHAAAGAPHDIVSRNEPVEPGRADAAHSARGPAESADHVTASGSAVERRRAALPQPMEPSDSDPPTEAGATDALVALWERIRLAMATRLGADVNRLWLERARPQSCSDGVLLLTVPTALGAEWLNVAGAPRCYDAICEAAGRRLLLRFVPANARDCL